MFDDYRVRRALTILRGTGNVIIILLLIWFLLSWFQVGFMSMGETSNWNIFQILINFIASR